MTPTSDYRYEFDSEARPFKVRETRSGDTFRYAIVDRAGYADELAGLPIPESEQPAGEEPSA